MPTADPRRGGLALAALFLAFGVVVATWVSRIPAVQADLGLGSGALGLALLGVPAGSVAASLLLPRVLTGNARTAVTVAVPFAALTLVLPGVAGSGPSLGATLFVFGAATGALDVAI